MQYACTLYTLNISAATKIGYYCCHIRLENKIEEMRYHWLINTTNGKLSLHEKQTEIIKNGFEHLIEMILWILVLMFNHSFYSSGE